MLLTDKEDILKQWTLHFSTLLNQTSAVADEALEGIQQRPIILELDAPPNTAETVAAVKQLQTGKAPGPDGIPAEVFKAGGEVLITHLTRLFQVFWANGKLPQDFRDANIIHLYKNKGDRSSCDNHREISLLSIAGKILARTLLNRITKHILDDMVSESQCGFRKQRGTVDMVLAIRQIQEKCVEQHQDLHLLFIDLTKAFDTVNRPALWAILSKLGCPPRFVEIIRSFHDGMLGRVIENGDASDPFPVANGMLSAALAQTSAGVTVHYRTDGDFFNIRRLKAHSKVRQAVVRDFLFADDCALAAHSEEDLQELADCFATAAKMFGLTISIKKTEVLRQLAPNTTQPPPNITMDGNTLKNVESFKYLGSSINSAANLDDEVLCRISQASRVFGRLHTRIWQERGISTKTKLSVYRAAVLPSLLYGCETWTCYRRHIKKLDQFHLRCLRKILRVSWKDREPNQEILRRAGLTGNEAMLSQSQLRWSGHVTRMDDSRLPKQLFHAELSTGKRHRGGQRKRYKDSLKSTLKSYNIPVDGWQAMALDRPKWRATIREGKEIFENCRLQRLDEKRQARKTRVPDPSTAVSCDLCGKNPSLSDHINLLPVSVKIVGVYDILSNTAIPQPDALYVPNPVITNQTALHICVNCGGPHNPPSSIFVVVSSLILFKSLMNWMTISARSVVVHTFLHTSLPLRECTYIIFTLSSSQSYNAHFSSSEFDFCRARSTVEPLAHFETYITSAFARHDSVLPIFFGPEKAYDTTIVLPGNTQNHGLQQTQNLCALRCYKGLKYGHHQASCKAKPKQGVGSKAHSTEVTRGC
ncbi:uncharacterized protein LOC134776864 [Penaeus indicus]|uniref:uncharacterized protein LOC134776864 n=1 Tax=Penaeus indicus TaxID=29960 RepID=UPI00300C24CF